MKKTCIPNPVESLGIIMYYSSCSHRLAKKLGGSIWYNCQTILSWFRRHEAITETRKKRSRTSRKSKILIFTIFSDFTNHWKITNRSIVLSHKPLPNFLKFTDRRQNVPTFSKTRFFRHILKNSTSLYACLCSHLFRTTTEIQLEPDAFDKSKLVMIFLKNLVLEKKVSKGIIQLSRLQFFEKFLAKMFPFSYTRDSTYKLLIIAYVADLLSLSTISPSL